jgi:hypothetical protein
VLGTLVTLSLPWLANRLLMLPWLPLAGPVKLVASLEGWWRLGICTVGGVVLGLSFAAIALIESLKVTLTDATIRLERRVAPRCPGCPAGLLGLEERVALVGGSITHGVRRGVGGGADFALEVWIPWAT